MGRTALLLLSLAASAASPPPASRAAARFDELVAAGRREQSEMAPLLDELSVLARSYEWERDAAKVEGRRAELRARLGARLEAFNAARAELGAAMRRFGDEHGLETFERLADDSTRGSPDIVSIMRAQIFAQQSVSFAARAEADLRAEEEAWRRFGHLDAERRSYRRLIWGLSLVFLAALAAVLYAARDQLRRRRPPPSGGPHRRGDVIDVTPE